MEEELIRNQEQLRPQEKKNEVRTVHIIICFYNNCNNHFDRLRSRIRVAMQGSRVKATTK